MEKDSFLPDEKIKMLCCIDNSNCSQPIAFIKVNFKRSIEGKDSCGNYFVDAQKLGRILIHGVNAKHCDDREIELDLSQYIEKDSKRNLKYFN